MDRTSRKFSHRGLTLIELMITLVILGVTVAVATPAMQQLIHGSRLRTETSRLLDAVNLARSEAVLRNIPVTLCPSAMAVSGVAACGGRFADGWIVFTNRNRDPVVDADSDEVIRVFEAIPSGYSLTNLAGTAAAQEPVTYLPGRLLPPQSVPAGVFAAQLSAAALDGGAQYGGAGAGRQGEGQCPPAVI